MEEELSMGRVQFQVGEFVAQVRHGDTLQSADDTTHDLLPATIHRQMATIGRQEQWGIPVTDPGSC